MKELKRQKESRIDFAEVCGENIFSADEKVPDLSIVGDRGKMVDSL